MKKLFSVLCLAIVAVSLSAKVVYCDPASTVVTGRAQNWGVAVAPSAMAGSLGGLTAGDTLCIKGGIVKVAKDAYWNVLKGITIIGGYDPDLTGTEHTVPSYPSATPTIFDGDVNGNGIPDAGDAEALIRVNLSQRNDQVFTLQGVTLRNTFHMDTTESKEDTETYMLETSALRLIMGTAYIRNCEIYNHRAPINRGSQSITVVGARVHFKDCNVHDSQSMSRGGLLRLREYFHNKSSEQKVDPDVVIERCAFYGGNAMGGDSLTSLGVYGGAIHASYGPLFIINSTVVLDTCYSNAGGIRPNPSGFTLISSTVGNNYCARIVDPSTDPKLKKETYGSCIAMDKDAPFFFMNNYVLDDADVYSKKRCLIYTDDNTKDIDENGKSGGYNVIGSFWYICNGHESENYDEFWQASDLPTSSTKDEKTFKFYLGDLNTKFKNNGGCSNTIMPVTSANGAMVADLQREADARCPRWTHVDASRDQRGWERSLTEPTAIGAADPEAGYPTALSQTHTTNYNQSSAMFNILGQPVDASYKGIVIQKGQKYLVK